MKYGFGGFLIQVIQGYKKNQHPLSVCSYKKLMITKLKTVCQH